MSSRSAAAKRRNSGGNAATANKRARSSAPLAINTEHGVVNSKQRDSGMFISQQRQGVINNGNNTESNLIFSCNPNSSAEIIEQEANRLIEQIHSGLHGELERRSVALQKAKDKKVASCDRQRKLQIRNINQLFEYEIEDANAIYEREYEELKKQMIMEVAEKKRRLQSQLTAPVPTGAGSAGNHTTQHSVPAAVAPTLMAAPASRSLRSTGPISMNPTAIADNAGPPPNKRRSEMPSSSSSAGLSLLHPTAPVTATTSSSSASFAIGAGSANLQHSLPEESMRADFLEIVRDMYQRSLLFQKNKPKSKALEVKMSSDLSEFSIGDEFFGIGDMVVVFSAMSQESFSGVISAISHRDVVMRTISGSRLAFFLGQVRNGSVTVSKDLETIRNAEMIQDSKAIQDINRLHHD